MKTVELGLKGQIASKFSFVQYFIIHMVKCIEATAFPDKISGLKSKLSRWRCFCGVANIYHFCQSSKSQAEYK
jgi:hypothetical protein